MKQKFQNMMKLTQNIMKFINFLYVDLVLLLSSPRHLRN